MMIIHPVRFCCIPFAPHSMIHPIIASRAFAVGGISGCGGVAPGDYPTYVGRICVCGMSACINVDRCAQLEPRQVGISQAEVEVGM